MKASAIVRIIIWSVVALALTGVLIAGLTSGFSFGGISLGSGFSYADSEHYLVGGNSIAAEKVSQIEVNWVSGEVEIVPYEGSEVVFREQSSRSLSTDDMMRFYLRDGKLIIQFCAPRTGFRIFSHTPSKRLEMKVPYALASALSELKVSAISAPITIQGVSGADMEVNNVSGAIRVSNLDCRELELDTVSGGISGQNLQASKMSMDVVSGSIDVSGAFDDVEASSVSGSVSLRSSVCPERIDMNSVSGSVKIWVPENDGFTAVYSSTSGQFTCNFPTVGEKKKAVYKDGGAKFKFSTVSGGITIDKI